MRWVEEQRDAAVQAIRLLETGTKPVTIYTLRSLGKLYTKEARADIMRLFVGRQRAPRLGDLDREINKAALSMWVDWHWRPENDKIHPSIGVCRSSPPSHGSVPSLSSMHTGTHAHLRNHLPRPRSFVRMSACSSLT